MIFIPRFAAVALGILLRPAVPAPESAGAPAAIASLDAIETVFVGTILDV